jgi:predicted PurR-regulated permease PerM
MIDGSKDAPMTADPTHDPDAAAPGGALSTLRNAAVFIAVMVGVFTLKYFNVILIPLVIAVFLLLLIDGFSRRLATWFPLWPGWLRSGLGALLTLTGFAVVVLVCDRYGRGFAVELVAIQPRLDAWLADLGTRFDLGPLSTKQLLMGHTASLINTVFETTRGALADAVLVVIYLGFLMASRTAFGRKSDRLFPGKTSRAHAERIFVRVRNASEQYIGLQTLKAALVAFVAWVIMSLLQVQGAPFLAFLFFLASYVPIVGGIVGVLVPSLVAFAQFGSPVRPLLLLVLIGSAVFLIENVLMPKLQSDRLNLDPVAILLALGFWGVVFGLPGALLSTPLTVVIMAVAAEFKGSRWLALLLSKEGELSI